MTIITDFVFELVVVMNHFSAYNGNIKKQNKNLLLREGQLVMYALSEASSGQEFKSLTIPKVIVNFDYHSNQWGEIEARAQSMKYVVKGRPKRYFGLGRGEYLLYVSA